MGGLGKKDWPSFEKKKGGTQLVRRNKDERIQRKRILEDHSLLSGKGTRDRGRGGIKTKSA